MWSEWLTRTLRPRPTEAAAKRVAAPVAMNDEYGKDAVRPSTRELALAAQDEEITGLAADR
jgi:hypothetical protein